MAEYIKNLWVLFKKEMIHCYRDPHVLIYGVLFPLLLYPIGAVGLVEFAVWQQGKKERLFFRVNPAADQTETFSALFKHLKNAPRLSIVTSDDPSADLKSGKIDAFIGPGKSEHFVEVRTNSQLERSKEAGAYVSERIEAARQEAVRNQLKEKGLEPRSLEIFTLETRDAQIVAQRKGTVKKGPTAHPLNVVLRYSFAFVLCILVLSIPAGAAYPAICAFTEEREKKTLESTLVLPVKAEQLITGKFLAVLAVALASGFLNFIGMALVAGLALSQARILKASNVFQFQDFLSFEMLLSLVFATLLFAALVSSLFGYLSAMTKSFKEAQNLLTIPLLLISPLPIAGLLPGVTLSPVLAAIPVLNLVLWVKSTVRGDADIILVFVIIAESVGLTLLFLYLLTRLVKTEAFVVGGKTAGFGEKLRRQSA